jgi:hypothetical protein
MYFSKTLPLFLAAGLSIASPIAKRNTTLAVDSNTAVNFALNLVRVPFININWPND